MSIQTPIMTLWMIKTPEVYRYMNQEFIDLFFEQGAIRLSSFQKFKNHTDEQRHDDQEGNNVIAGRSNSATILAHTLHGDNSFILCTSQVESEEIKNNFNCNGYFKIKNTSAFALAIAKVLPNFINGIEGPCVYSKFPAIKRELDAFTLEEFRANDGTNRIDLNKLMSRVNDIGGPDMYFTKDFRYINQTEYRFVWNVNFKVPEYIDIICPEAIQFCEKIT